MSQHSEAYPKGPELVFGLVAALGTDLEPICSALCNTLSEVSYKCARIQLSHLLHDIPGSPWNDLPLTPEDKRYDSHMDAGNKLREMLTRGDALALLTVGAIRQKRQHFPGREGSANEPISRQVYILRSLKHPEEVSTLREIYGSRFVLLAAYSPRETRLQNLARRIAESYHIFRTSEYRATAERLIQRDEAEPNNKLGQNVRDTFPMADVFIDVTEPTRLRNSITRFIELFFGNTFHTPTRDEYGMFHAQAAALRSAALGRQVGAIVSTTNGDIIAVGTNEVPKAGGGLYWCQDNPDRRDFILGYDTNDRMKRNLLAEVLERLQRNKWLVEEKREKNVISLVEEVLAGNPSPLMKDAQLMSLIEFGRTVHAEMAAITDAARRGIAIQGCTLYSTTFPCHDCAKHIVAAGIRRVVYIEPYPKSLAPELYLDSIAVDSPEGNHNYVSFEPFVGVSPRRYMDLFSLSSLERKTKDGKIIMWDEGKVDAIPRLGEYAPSDLMISVREEEEFSHFKRGIEEKVLLT